MNLTEHKNEIKDNMKEFLKKMNEEHGYTIENAKDLLISEVMDSAYEVRSYRNLSGNQVS